MRHHLSWAYLIGVAVLVLAVFAAAGLLSRTRSAPKADSIDKGAQSNIPVQPPKVMVAIRAVKPVQATVVTDGRIDFQGLLREGEARTFEGNHTIQLELQEGKLAQVTVNGHSLGRPGQPHIRYAALFKPDSFRRTQSGTSP